MDSLYFNHYLGFKRWMISRRSFLISCEGSISSPLDTSHSTITAFFHFVVGVFLFSRSDMVHYPTQSQHCLLKEAIFPQTILEMFNQSFYHDNLMNFFDSKHNRPPGTKPAADPMCTTINLVPLPFEFWGPVDRPSRNAIQPEVSR
jgi:hypothetical protein